MTIKEALRQKIDELTKERDEARELVYDCFNQACQIESDHTAEGTLYDHMFISSYEEAQAQLLKWGVIKVENCHRYSPPCKHDAELYHQSINDSPSLYKCKKCGSLTTIAPT